MKAKACSAATRRRRDSVFSEADRDRLVLILQGKRLGFTLNEIRELLAAPASRCAKVLPISRRKCIDQISLLERQRRDIDQAITELRQIYTEMLTDSAAVTPARMPERVEYQRFYGP